MMSLWSIGEFSGYEWSDFGAAALQSRMLISLLCPHSARFVVSRDSDTNRRIAVTPRETTCCPSSPMHV